MVTTISIIVPVYNEAENILPLAQEVGAAMARQAHSYELVLVDDASTDSTWAEIQKVSETYRFIRGLRHLHNAGQSAALWTGIQASNSPIIATLDGDLQNDPADLLAMFTDLEKVDFVSGMRLQRQDNFVRRTSSRIARWARKSILKVDFRDTGCAIRAFKRTTLENLFPFNGLHRFLPVLVHGNGAKTLEVPVNHRPRVAGVSKYGVWNRLGRGIYDLFGIAWYLKRRIRPVPASELKPK
ncbi:MAG TPA: glycosyltransferase family 2 protein [Candidatus Saccharimonadales bacterium]|nr:glycosyltransferase family 2 protein [Candidatus Saccharimonadales bacterium]